jgi:uncharacterized protein YbcI
MPDTGIEHPTGRSTAGDLSTAVVKVLSEYTGRGPTKARTYITDDLISVVLQDTLTRGELSLVRDGREALVLSMRKAFQETMRPDLVRVVEELTGRRVAAFFSDNSIDPDMALEAFVLMPDAAGNGHVLGHR